MSRGAFFFVALCWAIITHKNKVIVGKVQAACYSRHTDLKGTYNKC